MLGPNPLSPLALPPWHALPPCLLPQRAEEIDNADPKVAYYLRLHAIETVRTPPANALPVASAAKAE